MSKLDDLIREYCPNGVEYKKIKDVYKRLRGTPITAKKMKEIENPDGDIRVFAGGKTAINAFENDIPGANITNVPAVLVQSRGNIDFIYYDKPFTFKNEMWAYTASDKVSVKYLYYLLKNNTESFRDKASGMGSMPQISIAVTDDFLIPIPPFPVQEEIVRILDTFTELTSELTSELTARKKQYEYYRDNLLNVPKSNSTQYLLSDIAKIKNGKDYKHLSNGSYPVYGSGGIINYVNKYVYDKPSVLIPRKGSLSNLFYVDKPFWNVDTIFYTIIDQSKVLPKYFFYLLKKEHLETLNKAGGVPSLTQTILNKIKLTIPSIEVQKKIVNVLDNFDTICSDLSIGLPAEIESRQKQYEYYRDSLLTFAETGDIIDQTDRQTELD